MEDTTLPVGVGNADFSPVFFSGYTGPCHLDHAARVEAKQNFSITDAEKAFALLCAEILQLKMDENIFTGTLPGYVKNGYSVIFQPGDPGDNCNYYLGRVKIAGRSPDRKKLLQECGKLLLTLPVFKWLTVNSSLQENAVTFCRILPEGRVDQLDVNSAGIRGYGAEMIFSFCICVTPPESEIC